VPGIRVIDRYIAVCLLGGYGMVLVVLVAMFSFLAFMQELEDVGNGMYRLADALQYVVFSLPRLFLELAPSVVLLGGILGLGLLARGNQLVALRASGMSLRLFTRSVGKVLLVTAPVMLFAIEYVAPVSDALAAEKRDLVNLKQHKDLLGGGGIWARDGTQVLHIGFMWQGQVPSRLELFSFDSEGVLGKYLYADRAIVRNRHEWELQGVRHKDFAGDVLSHKSSPAVIWDSFLDKGQLDALRAPVESLSLSSLYQYARHLRETGQETRKVELIFWKKTVLPLTVALMALVPLPSAFHRLGPGFGRQILLGGLVGTAFFLLSQVTSHMGLLGGIDPLVIAVFPPAILAILVLFLFRLVSVTL
jgi:lipopolysaccharide export system permease protein